ncbi:MAG: hypothetical protein CGW95_09250 [Phenylobacterium zucineum]|nr:MAG: hypothetical protein CGW95_09250 [Phenylobacterium zucineum]
MEMGYAYAPILKYDANDDGTVTVYGKATDETLDVDQQICDNEWLKSAMPDWFEAAGNIREMHGSTAAGTATEYEAKADGHYIRAKIVDAGSVKKIKHGVLKGFSIGIRSPRVIRDPKAPGGRIVGGQIVEVSVVDRPANPSAKMTIAKAMNGESLMAVDQIEIPTPAEAFKNADVEAVAEVIADVVTEVVETVENIIEEAPAEEVAENADKAAGLLNTVQSLLKFDQATYDAAVSALSDLIIVEATEMKNGSDERDSIKELLHAIKHLFEWYEGEVAEGEVATPNPAIVDDAEDLLAGDLELSADVEMCDKCDMAMKDCKCADKAAMPEDLVNEIVAKAVAAATEAVAVEVDLLKSALVAEKEKATQLEADLVVAKSATVAGGPARGAFTKTPENLEVKARIAQLRNKAATATDKTLAKGYEELARDLEKSVKGQN